MDRREKIARLAQTKEDEVLLARVYERITMAAQRNVPASSCFLSKREQMLVQELLRGEEFVFFGGAALSEREVCCYLPEYLDESWLYSEGGPIAAVRASFYEQDRLTHRDFLGSLMGSGIKRETVGDIYVAGGSCDFLVLREILPYVLQNLTSAGRTKLSLQEISLADIQLPQQAVKTVRDTVPSLRLDGIISSGFSISRCASVSNSSRSRCSQFPGLQKILSKCTTGSPVFSPNALARVDFPLPPQPIIITRFIVAS